MGVVKSEVATQSASGAGTYQPSPPVRLDNPLGDDNKDIPTIIGNAIKVILGLLGTLTLFVFVDGAFSWVTSAGYPQRVQKGAKTMLFAVAGLFIIFASYAMLEVLFRIMETKGG